MFWKFRRIKRRKESTPGVSDQDQFVIPQDSADAFDVGDLRAQAEGSVEGQHILINVLRLEAVNRTSGLAAASLVVVMEAKLGGQRFESAHRLVEGLSWPAMNDQDITSVPHREVGQHNSRFN